MPEGPTIVILKDEVKEFVGRKVLHAGGYAETLEIDRLNNQVITDFKSWGKYFLICFKSFAVQIHFGLFGSYRINSRGKANAKLALQFSNGEEINFYVISVKLIDGDLNKVFDWSADIMNEKWSTSKAVKKLKAKPEMLLTDALLDQKIFSGSGNIIKNEVLFRCRLHPLNKTGDLTDAQLKKLCAETVNYSFDFLRWKQENKLRKHWEAYAKKTCPRDHVPFLKNDLGKTKRRTFYCEVCQKIYGDNEQNE